MERTDNRRGDKEGNGVNKDDRGFRGKRRRGERLGGKRGKKQTEIEGISGGREGGKDGEGGAATHTHMVPLTVFRPCVRLTGQ